MKYDPYRLYIALKLHFCTDSYDIIKYEGRVKRFLRKPKMTEHLEVFSKDYSRDEYIEYLVANFTNGDLYGGLFIPDGKDIYTLWKNRTQALSYNFKQNINTIKNQTHNSDILELFEIKKHHPLVMKLYLGKHIMLETVVILNIIYDFISKIDGNLKEDYMWSNFKRLVRKYQPFLCIEKEKYENIIESSFNDR